MEYVLIILCVGFAVVHILSIFIHPEKYFDIYMGWARLLNPTLKSSQQRAIRWARVNGVLQALFVLIVLSGIVGAILMKDQTGTNVSTESIRNLFRASCVALAVCGVMSVVARKQLVRYYEKGFRRVGATDQSPRRFELLLVLQAIVLILGGIGGVIVSFL
jgi:hypothetical protein